MNIQTIKGEDEIMSIRIKLIMMSLLFLAVPSLLIGIIGYQSSTKSLNKLGSEGLQTNVRSTIEMIGVLDKQVKAGKVSLVDAQEEGQRGDIGKKKDANGLCSHQSTPELKGETALFLLSTQQGLNSYIRTLKGKMYTG